MARAAAVQLPADDFDHLPFDGGYDTDTPGWNVPRGRVRESQNYEMGIERGYQDVLGVERLDGQTKPSAASYSLIDVTISGSFAAGDVITQLVSGATATVAHVVTTETPNYLVITRITGTFDATNALQVSAVTQGTATSLALANAASTPELAAYYKNLAADVYRALITVVPGEGDVWGVFELDNVVYAIRNAIGSASAAMYKSSSSGWVAVALGLELPFTSGGTYVPVEGDTITGATSAATAVVTRVMLETGTYAAGNATGKIIMASKTGNFVAENLDIGGNLDVATVAGNATAITLLPDGRLEFDISNAFFPSLPERVYGSDGVNRGFEFDGTVYCPIRSGMTPDTPEYCKVHKSQLHFSFVGSSQNSGIKTPYAWSAVTGATELALGSRITGYSVETGENDISALAIYSEKRLHILYGNSVADWNLVPYRAEIGAYARTVSSLGLTLFMHYQGLTSLRSSQNFGNFQDAALSAHIQTWLNARRASAVASCVVRSKNQYRVFFSDGSALYVTLRKGKVAGMMPVVLPHRVTAISSTMAADGTERIYYGSTDGYVYQMEKGTSFDGAAIDAYMTFHFNDGKSQGWTKSYKSAVLEAKGGGYAAFDFSYELGYSDPEVAQPEIITNELSLAVSRWNEVNWNEFFWNGVGLTPSRCKLDGTAENIALALRKNSDYFEPVLFTGARIRQLLRKKVR